MTDNIVDRIKELERRHSETLEGMQITNPQVYSQHKCFEWISDVYREQIANRFKECQEDEIPIITVSPTEDDEDTRLSFSCVKVQTVKEFYAQSDVINSFGVAPSEAELEYIRIVKDHSANLSELMDLMSENGKTPVFCQWMWTPELIEMHGDRFCRQPRSHVGFIDEPFSWGAPVAVKSPAKKKPVVPEKELEKSLMEWLHAYGIKADNQVTTARQRMDLWIPGHCFLELKKGKVSGDDVCQALDYCSNHKKPVILVGNHISEMASRGIEAFNNSMQSELIVFISWSGVRTYLRGLLRL